MWFFKKKQKKEERNTTGFPFSDEPNTACIVCKHVLQKEKPILYVSHDEEDGCWQFMCGGEHDFSEDARVIALAEAFELDASVLQVADMPCGCAAERESETSDWRVLNFFAS